MSIPKYITTCQYLYIGPPVTYRIILTKGMVRTWYNAFASGGQCHLHVCATQNSLQFLILKNKIFCSNSETQILLQNFHLLFAFAVTLARNMLTLSILRADFTSTALMVDPRLNKMVIMILAQKGNDDNQPLLHLEQKLNFPQQPQIIISCIICS